MRCYWPHSRRAALATARLGSPDLRPGLDRGSLRDPERTERLSFTGSAFVQRFEAKGDALTALADLSGVCTDGTTFVPMRPATTPLEVHIQTSSCDALDFTFGPVNTEAFVADLTNSHTAIDAATKGIRRDLCAITRVVGKNKGIDKLVLQLNRLIGAEAPKPT